MRKSLLFILICLFAAPILKLQAQDLADIDPILIRLKGQVVSKEDGLPVPYAHVVNMRNHGGTTTDSRGYFSMEMLNVDSLGISAMGFMREYIHIPPSHPADSIFVIWARPIRYAIREVEVTGEASQKVNMEGVGTGKPVDIDPELRGDAFNTKPPWYAAIFSPASFIQYHVSRKEKEKREARKAIVSEKRWEFLSQYYSKDIVMGLTGLDEAKADSFMIFFNSKGILNQTNNEYQVREAILREYELFKKDE
ncbi:carboxypeptidase-like regulatory domain-containing protein [Sunxiuqinia sp. A32]|uniref:carboxypeptidase-like regulatory domain-containing protein n=1 Tax=Sunxiuqinia sp. A32 TaxID=3461496 RepID=UPI004045DFBC